MFFLPFIAGRRAVSFPIPGEERNKKQQKIDQLFVLTFFF
jgi:hypothetical protein